jgi:hypothetical protein
LSFDARVLILKKLKRDLIEYAIYIMHL